MAHRPKVDLSMNKQGYAKINLRPGKDDDLIADLKRIPKTERSEYLRRIWRASLGSSNQENQLDLGAIRAVMESVLDSRLILPAADASDVSDGKDSLDSLDSDFLLE